MGPVMADCHFQHTFFTQSPLSSTLYITADNNNNTTSSANPPSPFPSSPSIPSRHLGQHQNYHFHQHHSLHDHNPHQHPTPNHNPAQISTFSTDQSSSATPPFPVNDRKDSTCYGSGSFPPDTYYAHAVAKYLLPDGPSMFGRRSDANCILCVGDVKYYVHVPMLASRSPIFRRIFTEMIDSEAWGPNGDASSDDYSTNSNIGVHDEQHDDLDVGHDNDSHHLLSGEVGGERGRGGGGWSAHASTPTSLSTSTTNTKTGPATTTTTTTTTTTAITTVRTLTTSIATTPTTSITSTTMDADSSMDEDQHGCYEDDDDDEEDDDDEGEDEEDDDETEQSKAAVEGEEEKLPRLTLHFADPVGSRFDELLYWIYTDQSDRWLTHFTPQNYAAILQNIALLNLATPTVLAICRAFEQSSANAKGDVPMGFADEYFMLPRSTLFPIPQPPSSTSIFSPVVESATHFL